MFIQTEQKKHYTPEEYLDLEVNSEERHDYIDGEIVTVVGAMPNHNQIVLNLAGTLNLSLKRQPYRVFVTDQRLSIPRKRIYTYPDVMVVQGDLQLQEGRKDTITNPVLIAEVLSESTEVYDPCGICEAARSGNFAAYRTIPTFQEYVLIDQYTPHVEHYFRTEPR